MHRIWWVSFVMGCWTTPAPVPPAGTPIAAPAPAPRAPAPAPDLSASVQAGAGEIPAMEAARRARADVLIVQRALSDETALLVTLIEDADLLALGPVGYAGTRTRFETAARELVARPDAMRAANHLVHHTQGAPRLYGLWILAAVDVGATPAAAALLRKDPDRVGSMNGCMMSPPEPMARHVDDVLARPIK